MLAAGYGLHGDDVTMCVMPLFHVHGLVATVLATLSTGGVVVLPRFRPSAFWDEAGRCGATWYTAVPTIHARLLTSVWGTEYGSELEYLRTFVRQLRRKLEDNPARPKYLLTESYIGYRFSDGQTFRTE